LHWLVGLSVLLQSFNFEEMTWLAIFIGGGLGSLARYGFGIVAGKMYAGPFPLGTFLSNLASCVILGFAILFFASRSQVSEAYKALILVGFCGGFSTFSTFSNETLELMKSGEWGWVIANVVLSLAVCLGVLYVFSKFQSA